MSDVAIIGAGPSGIAASIYLKLYFTLIRTLAFPAKNIVVVRFYLLNPV